MKVFLKELTFSGVKNIKDKLAISFGKKNVQSKDELSDYNIKSIYGPNGAGKTAIVHTLNLFKNIVSHPNYLNDLSNLKYLNEVLNKESDSINIKVEFYYFDKEDKPLIYVYNVVLKKAPRFTIAEEYYAYKRNEYAVEQVVFHSINGEIKQYAFTDESKQKTYNLLKERSFVQIILSYAAGNLDKENVDDVLEDLNKISPIFIMVMSLLIVLDKEDMYLDIKFDSLDYMRKFTKIYYDLDKEDVLNHLPVGKTYITDEQLKELEKDVKNKWMFVKLFKPDVNSIDLVPKLIKQDSDKNLYEVETFLDYGNYKVNLDYESMGIKKIFKLYDYFKDLTNGKIVVIDELDSHINDIFLTKMLEYTYEYAKGQLIFTSHSITPMETLRTGKNAIDFISISGKITSWKQIGNYSPTNLYKLGMIDGLPFNIWPESLMKVFVDEE